MASSRKTVEWGRLFNLVAFISLTLVGTALLLGEVLSGDISNAFYTIAEVLAYIVVAFYALMWAIERRNTRSRSNTSFIIHLVIWGIAVTLIVVFMILR